MKEKTEIKFKTNEMVIYSTNQSNLCVIFYSEL